MFIISVIDEIFRITVKRFIIALFLLLLTGDAIFLVLHVVRYFNPETLSHAFNLSRDGSYPEIFQYGKELACALLCVYVGFGRFRWMIHGWAPLFLFLFLDDALRIHEEVGILTRGFFESFPTLIRAQDVGELLASAAMALILFPIILFSVVSAERSRRWMHLTLVALVGAVAFFGIFVDLLHTFVGQFIQKSRPVFGFLEDGGEMIAMTLVTVFVASVAVDSATRNGGTETNYKR